MEGICTVEEVFDEIREMQLYNLTNDANREVLLVRHTELQHGFGENIKPEKVLLAVLEMKDGTKYKGLIINDVVVAPSIAETFMVATEPNGDLVLVISDFCSVGDHPYEEINLDKISNN